MRWYQGYRSSSWRVDETYVRVALRLRHIAIGLEREFRYIAVSQTFQTV